MQVRTLEISGGVSVHAEADVVKALFFKKGKLADLSQKVLAAWAIEADGEVAQY